MQKVHIKQKLVNMNVALDGIIMGDFDYIGEYTAKRSREPNDENYKKHGAFYRSNYERGILIYYLIRQYNLTSFLEVGFGRGYATFCAARAFHDAGVQGKIVTIDPALEENYVKQLQQVFPNEWFSNITFMKGTSQDVLPQLQDKFDLVYIDGDHSYEGTKFDWLNTKDKFNQFMLFDDYHLASKLDKGTIQCSQAIDEINASDESCFDPELIILDRRLFNDDRLLPDNQINYGQVLFTKDTVANNDW